MKLIKRCYGCGWPIMPWSETLETEKVGVIHKACLHEVLIKYESDKELHIYVEMAARRDALRAKDLLGLK